MADKNNNFGVITEQGFPAGQFGFDKLNEETAEKIKRDEQKKEEKK